MIACEATEETTEGNEDSQAWLAAQGEQEVVIKVKSNVRVVAFESGSAPAQAMRPLRLVLRSNKAHSVARRVGPLFLFLFFSVVVDTMGRYLIVFSSRLYTGKCWIARAYPNGIVTLNRPCLLCPIVISDCWRRTVAMPRTIVIHMLLYIPTSSYEWICRRVSLSSYI